MKAILYISALGLLLTSASCSQDKVLHNPRNGSYGTVNVKGEKRSNNKTQFKKNRNTIGLGLDLNGNNPYKFRMVDAGKPYKYSNKPK